MIDTLASPTVRANILLHSKAAATYNEVEPHFRPENLAKVRGRLERLRDECGGGAMLDLGCGTGFLIHLARDLFDEVHGVDVTRAMLDRIDTSSGNVFPHLGPAEDTPFPSGRFDLVTAYSFLHHTEDFRCVLREAARVLRPGGRMYIDLEPNRLFWKGVAPLAAVDPGVLSPIVAKARAAVLDTYSQVERSLELPAQTLTQAEPQKEALGKKELEAAARQAGFSSCRVQYDWFLGQGEVMHQQSPEDAAVIEAWLHSAAPLTDHLFKYLWAVLVR